MAQLLQRNPTLVSGHRSSGINKFYYKSDSDMKYNPSKIEKIRQLAEAEI